jgi:hypothetical protein
MCPEAVVGRQKRSKYLSLSIHSLIQLYKKPKESKTYNTKPPRDKSNGTAIHVKMAIYLAPSMPMVSHVHLGKGVCRLDGGSQAPRIENPENSKASPLPKGEGKRIQTII